MRSSRCSTSPTRAHIVCRASRTFGHGREGASARPPLDIGIIKPRAEVLIGGHAAALEGRPDNHVHVNLGIRRTVLRAAAKFAHAALQLLSRNADISP
ncbi:MULTISPECIES: DUF2169 domain-containing protein [Bradyrhizobium]|uniref:DUF2169 domain-containing protein n=1 Tax=Bradyrhizobium arachidis TaxID=858423 RepID=UPI000D58BC42